MQCKGSKGMQPICWILPALMFLGDGGTSIMQTARADSAQPSEPAPSAPAMRVQRLEVLGQTVYCVRNEANVAGPARICFDAKTCPVIWDPVDGSSPAFELSHDAQGKACIELNSPAGGVFLVAFPDGQRDTAPPARTMIPTERSAPDKTLPLTEWMYQPLPGSANPLGTATQPVTLDVSIVKVRWDFDDAGVPEGWHLNGLNDARWMTVDLSHPSVREHGADAWRTAWEGRYITARRVVDGKDVFGGDPLAIRTTLELPWARLRGWIAVVCASPFEVRLNGYAFPGKGSPRWQRFELRQLNPGPNALEIVTEGHAPAILAEGAVHFPPQRRAALFTHQGWEARAGHGPWQPAYECAVPPSDPYSTTGHPKPHADPAALWYRFILPAGTRRIELGPCDVEVRAWLDGDAITFNERAATVPPSPPGSETLPAKGSPRLLALRVELDANGKGLTAPLRIVSEPVPILMTPDRRHAQGDPFQAYARYTTTFAWPDDEDDKPGLPVLALGGLTLGAQVQLNGKPLGTMSAPPWRIDISSALKAGPNALQVLVANPLARPTALNPADELTTRWAQAGGFIVNHTGLGATRAAALLGPARIEPHCRARFKTLCDNFQPLCDNGSLKGWRYNPKLWRIEDGIIIGDSHPDGLKANSCAIAPGEYGDFVLRFSVKLHRNDAGQWGNSGMQFRSQVKAGYHVAGYQADVVLPFGWGNLHEQDGRRRLADGWTDKAQHAIDPFGWNDMEIIARGPRIVLKTNGVVTADYTEPEPDRPRRGVIALQLHRGHPMKVEFANLRIQTLEPQSRPTTEDDSIPK